MPSTTTRLAFPYPVLADNADVPEDIKALADRLAVIAAGYSQGTAAARPAPGVGGIFYWATDTLALSYDNGTAWQTVWPPTAGSIVNSMVNAAAAIAYSKLALTGSIVDADIASSGIGAAKQVPGTRTALTRPGSVNAVGHCSSRLDESDVVRLEGGVANVTGVSITLLATLAAGFRPASNIYLNASLGVGGAVPISILTDGRINMAASTLANTGVVYFDGLTFTTT